MLLDAQVQLDLIRVSINANSSNSSTNVAALSSAVSQITGLVSEMSGKISQTANLRSDLLKRFDTYKQQISDIEQKKYSFLGVSDEELLDFF